MKTAVALFRGSGLGDMELVSMSTEPGLTAYVASEMLREPKNQDVDPVLRITHQAERRALRIIKSGAAD